MSSYDDIDNPNYCEHNVGDMRESADEKEIRRLTAKLSQSESHVKELEAALRKLIEHRDLQHEIANIQYKIRCGHYNEGDTAKLNELEDREDSLRVGIWNAARAILAKGKP